MALLVRAMSTYTSDAGRPSPYARVVHGAKFFIMLRTKQIAPISQCARSFLISGSRSSKADGSSCTSSEDETSVSKGQQGSNGHLLPRKASNFVSKASGRAAGPIYSRDKIGKNVYDKVEGSVLPASVGHILPVPFSAHRSDGLIVNGDVHATVATHKNQRNSQTVVADQSVKTSTSSAGYLSDFANYKLHDSDRSSVFPSRQDHEVDSTKSVPYSNGRSSNTKSRRGENFSKVHGQLPIIVEELDSKNHCHGPAIRLEKFDSVKTADNYSSNFVEDLVGIPGATLDVQHQKQRSKRNSHSFVSTKTIPPSRQSNEARQVVECVYHTLKHLQWGPAAEKALGNLNCSLGVYQANQILKQLQDHSVAHGFFHWVKRQPGFKHDEYTYTTMIGILGRARQFNAMNKLLDEMVRDGCPPNVVTYNRLIYSYGSANYLNKAMNVFRKMQEVGCEPDRVTYCTLIDIHAKAGFFDVSLDLYGRMQEAGLSPDTFTYSVMINCLGKAGHLPDAYQLFCEMVSQGCVPSRVTYNILIALQAKARNYACALQLYRDMQAVGLHPDKVTYNIVMEVLGLCGYLEEAESLFAEMKRKNWVPDEPVYGLLVDLWGKSGNVDRAQEWYHAMLDAGLRPNVPTCNSLLSAFLRADRFSDAYHMLNNMSRIGLHPSLQTYTLLLSCCTETESPKNMSFCLELMAVTGHPAHGFLLSMPSADPYGHNVRNHANSFLDLMHSEDRESKRGLVDAVIDFLHKSGLKEEAGSMWEVASQKNIYPDVVREKGSCHWLINLHVMSDGTAVTALSRTLAWLRKQMLNSGIGPNRIDIVTGWGRRSKVTGSSLVRQSVKELLLLFQFPFFTENGNSGCFVGCGEALNRWLLHSYIERMHLL
ncbi:hypothetical protein Scep_017553 [Stephania cephalantha]|uniref:Smr domain-containing protein n=1 Tax=Stephania cephalantha TaxID=152367 RepID=A0AAP0IQN8_9MAGN